MYHTALDLHIYHTGGISVCGHSFLDFSVEDMDLSDADLEGAIFIKVNFTKCNFSGASLKNTSFEECSFTNCCLEDADFEGCQTEGLSICECPVEGASFDLAELTGFCLFGTTGRVSFEATDLDKTSNFIQCELWKSNFSAATIDNTLFADCNLAESVFSATTHLKKVTFMNCDVTNTWAFMAPGGNTCFFDECKVLPFCASASQVTYPSPSTNLAKSVVDFSIYTNMDYSAHLYCSDLEEFKGVV